MRRTTRHTWLLAVACTAALALPCHAVEPLTVDTPALAAPPPARAAAADTVRETKIRHGDTLNRILSRWGISHAQAAAWNARLPHTRRSRHLEAGDRVRACIGPDRQLQGLAIHARAGGSATLGHFPKSTHAAARTPAAPVAALFQPPTGTVQPATVQHVQFHITNSLDASLDAQRISSDEIAAIQTSLEDSDDLPGNFPSGTPVGLLLEPAAGSHQRLLRMRIWYENHLHELFSYIDASGRRWTLNRNGSGVLHLPIRTPVENARITSGWGWRDQPVRHVPEFHKGIDYAAPLGTPVRAAASGVVQFIGWRGNYGKLVTIGHTPDTQTRYGHLSRAAADLRVGSPVKAGQVIGYIGSTGLSTGPHLYFELWQGTERHDPLTTRVDIPVQLAGPVLASFDRYVQHIDRLRPGVDVARGGHPPAG
ncbi:MAG: M23 family metallopeptidase [Nevskiaceae bacterium]|nr:MAG: M23 family metallopeptidase [Nevskiaceae bacterium]TBR73594.1 MAG: M23 family metallopeptidase [Nevskiaceae bacterium]